LSNNRKALVVGSTGLIGKELIQIIQEHTYYKKIYVPVRREVGFENDMIEELVIDFDKLDELLENIYVHDVYCCLGTTMKKAGCREAFYTVDYNYPVKIAKLMHKNGAESFLNVSALGANKNSMIFYNRVKGEVEEALIEIGFKSLAIFRPSLLLGDRSEKRIGEDIAKKTYKVLDKIFIGPLKKYSGIEGRIVARAMFEVAKRKIEGVTILESDEIRKA